MPSPLTSSPVVTAPGRGDFMRICATVVSWVRRRPVKALDHDPSSTMRWSNTPVGSLRNSNALQLRSEGNNCTA